MSNGSGIFAEPINHPSIDTGEKLGISDSIEIWDIGILIPSLFFKKRKKYKIFKT